MENFSQQISDSIMMRVSQLDLQETDLNKLNSKTIQAVKEKMDQHFFKNQVNKDDKDFVYDKRENFQGEESNEWDDDLEDDF